MVPGVELALGEGMPIKWERLDRGIGFQRIWCVWRRVRKSGAATGRVQSG